MTSIEETKGVHRGQNRLFITTSYPKMKKVCFAATHTGYID